MTINLKPLLKQGIPKYLAISEALKQLINSGELAPGARLPTHRLLADQLEVSVQTVSNAYTHAAKRGLVEALIGSGTYVSHRRLEHEFMLIEEKDREGHSIDLSIAHPVCSVKHTELYNDALLKISRFDNSRSLRAIRPVQGQAHHIEAVAHWLGMQKLAVESARVILCNGASHGLMLALGTAVQAGDTVACENLVDHGLIARARILNIRLRPLATDREGILPDALEEACRQQTIKALCCTPSMSNPNSTHMGLQRRVAIAEVAQRFGLMVIEDDVYGALEPNRTPPISSLLPDSAFYVTSLTKTVAPGIRAGFLVAPRHLLRHTIGYLAATSWMATPLLFDIASLWIQERTLEQLIGFQQQELASRQQLAGKLLQGFDYDCHPNGMHLWLQLPEGWHTEGLLTTAKQANLLITGYQPFITDQERKLNRVRLSLGVENSRSRLGRGLKLLADILRSPPPPTHFLL